MTEPAPSTFAMAVAAKPVSSGGKRKHSRWYDQQLQEAAHARGARLLSGPLYVRIVWFQSRWERGDVDNIAKRVLDALKGIVFQDDDEIVWCLTQKTLTSDRSFAIDASEAPSDTTLSEIEALIGSEQHVLYIEIGPITNLTISLGPVR